MTPKMERLEQSGVGLPPEQEAEGCGDKAAVEKIDAVMHLGAPRAREGLADAEKFLILCISAQNHQPPALKPSRSIRE